MDPRVTPSSRAIAGPCAGYGSEGWLASPSKTTRPYQAGFVKSDSEAKDLEFTDLCPRTELVSVHQLPAENGLRSGL